MRIFLTGHTSGIGQSLHDHLSRTHEVTGFSRSTGHDITDPERRGAIVGASVACDVFINNAHAGFGQTQLLYELFQFWTANAKRGLILNIGSRGAESHMRNPTLMLYSYEKLALKELATALTYHNHAIKVCCLNLGYIGTDAILARAIPRYVSLSYVCETVDWLLVQPAEVVVTQLNVAAYSPTTPT